MSALRDFLSWWGRHLLELLPGRVARRDTRLRDALVAQWRHDTAPPGPGSGLDIAVRRRGREEPLGRFALDDAGIRAMRSAFQARARPAVLALRPPPGALLEREVVLPLAAERDVARVLGYEMDRFTPFAAAELFWTWSVERADRAGGRLHLRVSLVPKAAVATAVEALGRAGMAPAFLEDASAGGTPRVLPLRPVPSGAGRWRRAATVLAGAACAALAVAVTATPFVQQSLEVREVEARIAALRPQADRAEALRRQAAAARAGGDLLAAQRARVGDALEVLAALTRALPDDTFLTDFALRSRTASLSGQSAAAARLIAILSADRAVRNPAFAAPVTRNEAGRSESFSIRAEFAP